MRAGLGQSCAVTSDVIARSSPRTMCSAALTSATIFTFAQTPRQPDLKRGDGDRRYKDDPDRDQHQQLPSCPWGIWLGSRTFGLSFGLLRSTASRDSPITAKSRRWETPVSHYR